MSNICDRGVIDYALVEDNKYVLVIVDHLEWRYNTRERHLVTLQDKINDYLDYIESGQISEENKGLRPVIRIIAEYSYSKYCIDFLKKVKTFIKNNDNICELEWVHISENEKFDDGFSDDYIFDSRKIYPRLKKNWANNPLKEISIMGTNDNPQVCDNLVMFRVMDSFIGLFVVDFGDEFMYFTHDMLPSNITIEQLQEIAFDNLSNNIQYRFSETKEKGIYGILAGGNFEAESILWPDLWEELAEKLNDDIIISIPTKDVVYYTNLSNKKTRNKMFKIAKKMLKQNSKDNPHLIFCKDIFVYSRDSKKIFVSDEYSL